MHCHSRFTRVDFIIVVCSFDFLFFSLFFFTQCLLFVEFINFSLCFPFQLIHTGDFSVFFFFALYCYYSAWIFFVCLLNCVGVRINFTIFYCRLSVVCTDRKKRFFVQNRRILAQIWHGSSNNIKINYNKLKRKRTR